MVRIAIRSIAVAAFAAVLMLAPACRKRAYDNPITKDTQQPDKVLFDTAVDDIEHGRYERARLTLQTLMNTYDTSEYLAKAKLAVADSWYREAGAHGFAQAEAEYKDFILFYPQMEEAAEAQDKICRMQYQQMDKADRDPTHTVRAQDECRQLITQFPNSKYVPEAQQLLRNVQEQLAQAEFKVGDFYHNKGSYPAAANRLQALSNQFPLFSQADDALWEQADAYQKMGDNFENQEAAAYSKLVREYPLSSHVGDAKARLTAMKRPVPEVDPVRYSQMKYELENRGHRSIMSKVWGPFSSRPDMTAAAKSGTPTSEPFHPGIPASVPSIATGTEGTSANPGPAVTGGTGSDVTATQVKDTSLIDTAPNVLPGAASANGTPASGTPASGTPAASTPANGGAAPAGQNPANAAGATTPTSSSVKVGGVETSVSQQAAPNPNAPLPQNHTGKIKKLTPAQQLKLAQKQQEQLKKMQKKQAEQDKKAKEDQAKADKKKKKGESQDQTPPAPAPQPSAKQ